MYTLIRCDFARAIFLHFGVLCELSEYTRTHTRTLIRVHTHGQMAPIFVDIIELQFYRRIFFYSACNLRLYFTRASISHLWVYTSFVCLYVIWVSIRSSKAPLNQQKCEISPLIVQNTIVVQHNTFILKGHLLVLFNYFLKPFIYLFLCLFILCFFGFSKTTSYNQGKKPEKRHRSFKRISEEALRNNSFWIWASLSFVTNMNAVVEFNIHIELI